MPTIDMKVPKAGRNPNIVTIRIEVQNITRLKNVPEKKKVTQWARQALRNINKTEFTIRIVDEEEMLELNKTWRGIDKTTNVLSFPAGNNSVVPELLGDIAICAPVIEIEASEQNKTLDAHWAHMVIHGVLHLQGFDHIQDSDAQIMETEEIRILNKLGFTNPYE
jgi:probable rRNA maturation factor